MRILITGINGSIGRIIAKCFYKKYNIIGIGRTEKCVHKFYNEYIKADISDGEVVKIMTEQKVTCDVIIHCAAVINSSDEDYFQVNIFGTYNIMKVKAVTECKKIIYISSLPLIGIPGELPITEEHEVRPINAYYYSKYLGEEILRCAYKEDAFIFRICSPISMFLPKNKILPSFISSCLSHNEIVLLGKGERVQNYIDVRDIARAIELAIKKDRCGGVYNIVGESISNYELAQLCKRILSSKSMIRFIDYPGSDDDIKWIVSGDKALKCLGYKSQYSIEKSIIDMVKEMEDVKCE